MWELRNLSDEDLEVVHVVDVDAPGCRVSDSGLNSCAITETVRSNETLISTGYEPGVSYIIRPKHRPEKYRGSKDWTMSDWMKNQQRPIEAEFKN